MAFVDILSAIREFFGTIEDWSEEYIDQMNVMRIGAHVSRWYRLNRSIVQCGVVSLLALLLAWFFIKGYLVQLARRARLSIEDTIATKVDQIASQFDDALQVSFRKATWELVKDNVGIYALQGRRGTMEDRFTFVNRLEQRNTSIYGVFDGHGGEVRNFLSSL